MAGSYNPTFTPAPGPFTDPTGGPYQAPGAAVYSAENPEPLQYQTDPTGVVHQFNARSGTWTPVGIAGQASAVARQQGLQGLLSAFNSGGVGGGYSPAQVSGADFIPSPMPSGTAFDPAAEAAIYGKAKEKIGQQGSAALRSLRNALGARGISGGGSERALTSGIYDKMQGELSDTDRAIATDSANKAWQAEQMNSEQGFEAGQANAARNEQVQEFNATAKNAAALQAQQLQNSRISQLIAAFGSLY